MNDAQRAAIPEVLNRLPFVRWDRLVDDGTVAVYGWIAREDGRADFVLASFLEGGGGQMFTSSAERSAEIAELISGGAGTHVECQRVEDVFGEQVENAIRLEVSS